MSAGVIAVAGYGGGISHAVATKFGSQGFKVALLSRTQSKLDTAAKEYAKSGIVAKGFSVDLSSFDSVKSVVPKIKSELGPPTILFWNPYGAPKGFLEATSADLVLEFNTDVSGLVAAVQASYEDLKAQAGKSAILVTGGAAAIENDGIAQFIADAGWTTFATAKAAQRKLVHVMNKKLSPQDIYVAEATVMATVKGTPYESAGPTVTPDQIADTFWDLYTKRDLSVWAVPVLPS